MELATTVAVLYPGEMGAALARLLAGRGTRVVTTLENRSQSTAVRAREAGIVVLDSLRDVVREAQVVFSLVPPAIAETLAQAYCELARFSPPGALYVEANSIGPVVAQALSARLAACGRGFVDAAINGPASNAGAAGTLFLSGPRAAEVAALTQGAIRTEVLGEGPAAASAMKMALGGLAKGLCALFAEMSVLAERQKILPQMLDAAARIYPGVYTVVQRMLPTYATHASRRATEMSQVEQTLLAAGIEPLVIRGVREAHERWAAAPFDSTDGGADQTVAAILRHWANGGSKSDQPRVAPTDLNGSENL